MDSNPLEKNMDPRNKLEELMASNPEVRVMMSVFSEVDYIYHASLEAMGCAATPVQTSVSCEKFTISLSNAPVSSTIK